MPEAEVDRLIHEGLAKAMDYITGANTDWAQGLSDKAVRGISQAMSEVIGVLRELHTSTASDIQEARETKTATLTPLPTETARPKGGGGANMWNGGNWWGVFLNSAATSPMAFFTYKGEAEAWAASHYSGMSTVSPMKMSAVKIDRQKAEAKVR